VFAFSPCSDLAWAPGTCTSRRAILQIASAGDNKKRELQHNRKSLGRLARLAYNGSMQIEKCPKSRF
jgi:hypothetical protein